MFLRKYWIALLLLLVLASPISWAAAEHLTEPNEALGHNLGASGLSEDLAQRFSNLFQHDFLIEKLLDSISIRPQLIPPYAVKLQSLLPYKDKNITSITLHKQGVFSSQATWWQSGLHKITPITKDWVIWDELHLAVGDRLAPAQLIQSEIALNKLPFIEKAKIEVQACKDSNDAVDIHVTTQDQLPITWDFNLMALKASLGYNNMLGWGHSLEGQLLYKQGLGHGVTYRAPNIRQSGITGELQHYYIPQRTTSLVRAFRKFNDQASYAGKIVLGHTRQAKRRLLDGHTYPQLHTGSFYHWDSWLGRAFRSYKEVDRQQIIVTGGIAGQYFTKRPKVSINTNRYFHHYLLGTGSIGLTNKKYYEALRVYGVGDIESIPYGSKVNLIGGYQLGEFVNRPYLRFDLAQGGRVPTLGHWYGAMNIGGFGHAKTVEQGIVRLQLHYFTPLFTIGGQWLRQFIQLSYLGGFNMFTGEFISTNTRSASSALRDPFWGGTKRFQLDLETVLFPRIYPAGCQLATLGFVEAVRLQNSKGSVKQSSCCKALGIGFRCSHPRWRLGTLQVKGSYYPLVQGIGFELSNVGIGPWNDLNIDAPGTIPFQEY